MSMFNDAQTAVRQVARTVSQYVGGAFHEAIIPASQNSLIHGNYGSIEHGTIIDIIPHTRCYRIMTAARTSSCAYPLDSSAFNTIQGPNNITVLPIGTHVLVYYPYEGTVGYILGGIPDPIYNNNLAVPPSVAVASDIGVTESAFDFLFKGEQFQKHGYGVVNVAGGAPTDSLPGDWGYMTELGIGVLISKWMTFLRASPNCGLFAFYLDSLLRIHGYNYELLTSSTEHRIYNDESEVHDVQYRTKFPWEALGLGLHGVDAFQVQNTGWKPGNKKAYYEPKELKQTGLWREVELRGYLGDLHRVTVALPSEVFESQPITYDSNKTVAYAGLSEITRDADGRVGIRSAKEIVLSKYAFIPVPQQKTLPDDNKAGDWHKNYKASNEVGDGTKVADKDDWTWTQEEDGDIKAALLPEYLAFVFNWYKYENIVAHKEDWFVAEEGDKPPNYKPAKAVISADALIPLRDSYWAKLPKKHDDVKIDSRIKKSRFYESMSNIAMLDDGSIIIEDGWGSSIVMTKGHIQLCAMADVFVRPGRSFYAWAPKDAMLRAGGSIDLTATTKDVRIKAESNLHLLAGNDGPESTRKRGGILLESRSEAMTMNFTEDGEHTVSGGVVVKCKNSDFAVWSNNIYMGTKKLDKKEAGIIFLSADEGKQNVMMQGKNMLRDIGNAAVDTFSRTHSNYYKATGTVLDTQNLIVLGGIAALTDKGHIYAKKNIACVGPVISEGSGVFGGSVSWGGKTPTMLAPNEGKHKGQISKALQVGENMAKTVSSQFSSIMKEISDAYQVGEDRIGSQAMADKVKFSLRTDDDYKAKDFKVFAARWQLLMKELGVSTEVWKERSVMGTKATFPFPGREGYTGGEKFFPNVTMKLFSFSTGKATARGADGGLYLDRTNAAPGGGSNLNTYTSLVQVQDA